MREIKFRAKRVDDGEWIYGARLFTGCDLVIVTSDDIDNFSSYRGGRIGFSVVSSKVDPDTVGQFTGLKDKNGQDIYDGDIMHIHCDDDVEPIEIKFGDYDDGTGSGVFEYHNGFYLDLICDYAIGINFLNSNSVILGNIHDNPELQVKST